MNKRDVFPTDHCLFCDVELFLDESKRLGYCADHWSLSAADCTCYMSCRQDSHSGEWHQHEDDPCHIHPDAIMVG